MFPAATLLLAGSALAVTVPAPAVVTPQIKTVSLDKCQWPTYSYIEFISNGKGVRGNNETAPDPNTHALLSHAVFTQGRYGFAENATVDITTYGEVTATKAYMYVSVVDPYGPTGWKVGYGSNAQISCTDGTTQSYKVTSKQGRNTRGELECIGEGNNITSYHISTGWAVCVAPNDASYDKHGVLNLAGEPVEF